jgi:hypothetical protein
LISMPSGAKVSLGIEIKQRDVCLGQSARQSTIAIVQTDK